MTNLKHNSNRDRIGFTLVEILVVLVIATVVISIAIPRIRTVNKERNVREAARVVGSAFANASQRALIDGVAGVRISRNANFVMNGTTQQFAATEISILRKVPNFAGDQAFEPGMTPERGASKISGTVVEIPTPIERDVAAERFIIREGDSISFNNSNVRFQIDSVDTGSAGKLNLTLDVQADSYPKLPEALDDVPYVIYRQPRILRSSTTSLPENYIVDLRYSGFLVEDAGAFDPASGTVRPAQLTRVFEPAPVDFGGTPPPENYDIEILFDANGAVDQVLYKIGTVIVDRNPLGPLYFLITESPDSLDLSAEVATADEQALWVTVSTRSGSTNIGYNNPITSSGFTLADFSEFYFAAPDPLNMNDRDRDRFNAILNDSRDNSATSSANQ